MSNKIENKKFMQQEPEEYILTIHMQNLFNTYGEEKVIDFIRTYYMNQPPALPFYDASTDVYVLDPIERINE